MHPEISVKTAAMRNVTKSICGDFLYRPNISLEPRLLVLRMLILSKGLFQAGTWPLLHCSEFSRVHSEIMRIYSSMIDAGVPVASRRSHEALLKIEGVTAPYILILFMRINLFI